MTIICIIDSINECVDYFEYCFERRYFEFVIYWLIFPFVFS